MTIIGTLRKMRLSEAEGYLRRCPNFVNAGFQPVCVMPCKICDGCRRLTSLLQFFAKRDCLNRPERRLFVCLC